jgi:NAD+ diphosphatase
LSSLAEVAEALRNSESPDSPYHRMAASGGTAGAAGQAGDAMPPPGFFVPPPIAIAHHLMRQWVEHAEPWFPQQQVAAQAAADTSAAVSNL